MLFRLLLIAPGTNAMDPGAMLLLYLGLSIACGLLLNLRVKVCIVKLTLQNLNIFGGGRNRSGSVTARVSVLVYFSR